MWNVCWILRNIKIKKGQGKVAISPKQIILKNFKRVKNILLPKYNLERDLLQHTFFWCLFQKKK